jgi:hypothetical protein
MKPMTRKQRNIAMKLKQEAMRNNKMKNIIRIDIETRLTENALSQSGETIIRRFDDDEINAQDRDARLYYNKNNYPISESNMQENDRDFDRRQFHICQILEVNHPGRKYDRYYKKMYGDDNDEY